MNDLMCETRQMGEAEETASWEDEWERLNYERERREAHREEIVGYARAIGKASNAEKLTFFACTIPFRDACAGVDFVTITRGEWEDPTSAFYHASCEACRRVHR